LDEWVDDDEVFGVGEAVPGKGLHQAIAVPYAKAARLVGETRNTMDGEDSRKGCLGGDIAELIFKTLAVDEVGLDVAERFVEDMPIPLPEGECFEAGWHSYEMEVKLVKSERGGSGDVPSFGDNVDFGVRHLGQGIGEGHGPCGVIFAGFGPTSQLVAVWKRRIGTDNRNSQIVFLREKEYRGKMDVGSTTARNM
jgi:hypothetical protein